MSDTSALPFSPLTDTGLEVQCNDRAAQLSYDAAAGWSPALAVEARRVYEMCKAHSNRVVAILGSVAA